MKVGSPESGPRSFKWKLAFLAPYIFFDKIKAGGFCGVFNLLRGRRWVNV